MTLRRLVALALAMALVLCGCGDDGGESDPAPSHEVDVIRLDTPTPAPTPEQEQVTVYSALDSTSVYMQYSHRYVNPALAIHGSWTQPEDISADDIAGFFLALGDERRGYSIDDCLVDGEYRIPSERFVATITASFKLSESYLIGLPIYDAELDCFVIPLDRSTEYFAEVYRVEERPDELRVRYVLYAYNSGGYYTCTDSRFELVIEEKDGLMRYMSSVPVAEEQPLPPPQNGQRYINTEISDAYSRRELTIDEMTSEGDMTLVKFSGRWSGLELFDRISGQTSPVACFVTDINARDILVSAPFDAFEAARLGAWSLGTDGSVRLLVQSILSKTEGDMFPRVYTLRDGRFSFEQYSSPLGSAAMIGMGGGGSLYSILPGSDSRVAMIFNRTGALPQLRVSSSQSTLTVRMMGVSLPEDFVTPRSRSSDYSIASVEQQGDDVLLTLYPSDGVSRFKLLVGEPIAGDHPYVELELVKDPVDYPEGW